MCIDGYSNIWRNILNIESKFYSSGITRLSTLYIKIRDGGFCERVIIYDFWFVLLSRADVRADTNQRRLATIKGSDWTISCRVIPDNSLVSLTCVTTKASYSEINQNLDHKRLRAILCHCAPCSDGHRSAATPLCRFHLQMTWSNRVCVDVMSCLDINGPS